MDMQPTERTTESRPLARKQNGAEMDLPLTAPYAACIHSVVFPSAPNQRTHEPNRLTTKLLSSKQTLQGNDHEWGLC